ncbi:MAG: hypothetical protein JST84_19870 [Acidobacteria bacterium]|nr:hypothetical protein [Acidobacteriota bacterium]
MLRFLLPLAGVFLFVASGFAQSSNSVTVGEFIVEPPTLLNLGFEWNIKGDDNRNASVAVQFRKVGDAKWSEAQPLLRIGDEKVGRARNFLEYWTPRKFAGSILDLEENTAYECRFTMSDPDGVKGQATQQVTVKTRGVPKAYSGGRTLHVYPPDYEGPKQEPSFRGLKEAYYGPGTGDWAPVHERPVQPGDVILVHAGLYKADRMDYVTPYGIPFDGTYVFTLKGTAEKPIVIRGAGDGEAIFDGAGNYRLFDVMGADYNYFENITIRNTDIAFYAGLKELVGCSGLVVRNCRMEDVGVGVFNEYEGSKNFYIADNVLLGRDDRNRLIGWSNFGAYKATQLKSFIGIKVYGQGHVICHNYVAYFHDAICISTYGTPPADPTKQAVAIDIYNNDIFVMVDDFIESDGGVHNIRIARNRGFNAAQHGLSAQPAFGGPVYFYRNILYSVPMGGGLKTGNGSPAGVLIYHNTFITENSNARGYSNWHYRNNLILGTNHPDKPVLGNLSFTSYSTLDYDGYRPNPSTKPQFVWKAPAKGVLRDYNLTPADSQNFATLAEFQKATGHETHGIVVDYDIFKNVRPPDPGKPHAIYAIGDFDFNLRPTSAAVDAGCRLPNLNDDFAGRAPDLGALESGRTVPHFGPRN